MKVLVSGSTGLIGSALIRFLKDKKWEVFKLVWAKADLKEDEIAWDPAKGVIISELLEGFDVVVHLAGESIMGRWSEAKKERIRSSRVKGTRSLFKNLCQLKTPPSAFICASAVGYYGDQGNKVLTEGDSKGEGFLADVCEEWERASKEASEKRIRTVNIRIGMVLTKEGGALKLMLPAFKLGFGGKIGSGEQYLSWIEIGDLIRIIDFSIDHKNLSGAVNAVSPYPITNFEFTKTLGSVLHRPTFFSIPAFAVKFILGDLGEQLLLSSQRVQPKKLEEAGFKFNYPHLVNALQHLVNAK